MAIKTNPVSKTFYISKVKDVFLYLRSGDYKDADGKLIKNPPHEFARSYNQENAELILSLLNSEATEDGIRFGKDEAAPKKRVLPKKGYKILKWPPRR